MHYYVHWGIGINERLYGYSVSTLPARGPTLDVRIWCLKAIPAMKDIYDNFKLKNPFSPHGLYNNMSAL